MEEHAAPFIIEADALRYSYQPRKVKKLRRGEKAPLQEALQGLSFRARRGRITGLLGPNGSGKTTAFKILSTQLQSQGGRALVNGFDVSSQQTQVRAQLAVTFQSPSLDAHFSVQENLQLHAALYGLRGAAAAARIAELLALFRLQDRRDTRISELSGGLARRVELAKALLSRPQLLLMDEPTTGLDPLARREFWQELRTLVRTGLSVLVTTHLMEEAELCDELLFIAQGKLAGEGSPEQLRSTLGQATVQATVAAGVVDRAKSLLQTELGNDLRELTVGSATLADVYFAKTGLHLHESQESPS